MADKELSILISSKDKTSDVLKKIAAQAKAANAAIVAGGGKADKSLDALSRSALRAEKSLDKLNNAGKRMKSGGIAAGFKSAIAEMTVADALVQKVAQAWKFAIATNFQYQDSWAKLGTILGTQGKPTIDRMRQGVIALSRETGINHTATQLAATAYTIFSSGVTDAKVALDVMRASSKLATAGVGDLEQSTNILTTAVNAFKEQGITAGQAATIIYAGVKGGKTTVEEMAQAFGKNAGNAAAAGVSMRDYVSATAAIAAITGKTSEAQNALGQAYNETTKSGNKFTKAMQQAGISQAQWAGMIKKEGFVGALEEMQQKLKMSDQEFKNLFGSAEAGTAVYQLLSVAGDNYRSILAGGATAQRDFNNAVSEGSKGPTQAWNRLKAAAEAYSLQLDKVGISIAAVLDAGTALVDWMAQGQIGAYIGEWIYGFDEMWSQLASDLNQVVDDWRLTWEQMQSTAKTYISRIAGDLWAGVKEWVNPLNWFKDETVGHSIIPDTMKMWQVEFDKSTAIIYQPISKGVKLAAADLNRLQDLIREAQYGRTPTEDPKAFDYSGDRGAMVKDPAAMEAKTDAAVLAQRQFFRDQYLQATKDAFNGGTDIMADAMARMIRGQKVSGKAMVKAAGQMIGGILSQMGTAYVAEGAAVLAEGPTVGLPNSGSGLVTGPNLIARGLALKVLGSLLAGGGGGGGGGKGGGGGGHRKDVPGRNSQSPNFGESRITFDMGGMRGAYVMGSLTAVMGGMVKEMNRGKRRRQYYEFVNA